MVVVNPDSEKQIAAKVNLRNAGTLMTATPEQPDARSTTGTLEIPARSVAVLIEQ